jgi:hypothetical protein
MYYYYYYDGVVFDWPASTVSAVLSRSGLKCLSVKGEKGHRGICACLLMRKPFRNSERGTEAAF